MKNTLVKTNSKLGTKNEFSKFLALNFAKYLNLFNSHCKLSILRHAVWCGMMLDYTYIYIYNRAFSRAKKSFIRNSLIFLEVTF